MVKKVIIGIVLLITLFLFVFKNEVIMDPSGFFGALGCSYIVEKCGVVLGSILSYIQVCTGLLFWVGASAGWRWARGCDFQFFMSVFCAFVGIYLSFPIAIFNLLVSKN